MLKISASGNGYIVPVSSDNASGVNDLSCLQTIQIPRKQTSSNMYEPFPYRLPLSILGIDQSFHDARAVIINLSGTEQRAPLRLHQMYLQKAADPSTSSGMFL